mgnify:CR=1 FL=1
MQFVQNFPFFCILLTLMGAVASSVMNSRMARRTTLFLILADLAMNVSVMIYTLQTGDSYAYKMGHFPAPWGNEIRVGVFQQHADRLCDAFEHRVQGIHLPAHQGLCPRHRL